MASLEGNLTFDQDVDIEIYIRLLEIENESLRGLKNVTQKKQTSVETAFSLIGDGANTRNYGRTRAKFFMDQVLIHSKELFVLCGMGTNLAAQGKIHTTSLDRLWRWWKNFCADPVLSELTEKFFIKYEARKKYVLDLSELRKCQEVLSRLYPTRDISSLFKLTPNDLLSLLDADRGSSQPLPPHPSGPSDNSTNPPSPKSPKSPNFLKRGGDEGSGPLAKRSRLDPHANSTAQEPDAFHLSHDFGQLYGDTAQTWGWDVQRGVAQNPFHKNAVPDSSNEGALKYQFDGDTSPTWGQDVEGDTNRTWGGDAQYSISQNLFDGDRALP
ncbi:hypothetical protein B0J14DRAFT_568463 [Halenospora varia]|nr:hypothetical protein B0J14DRAFT_568463 [Halenospora varia]